MSLRILTLVCVLGGVAHAGDMSSDADDNEKRRNVERFLKAIEKHDVRAMKSMLDPALVPKVWFVSEPCRTEFDTKAIDPKRIGAWIDCLAELDIKAMPVSMDLYYGPFYLALRFKKKKMTFAWTIATYAGFFQSTASDQTWTAGSADVLPPPAIRARAATAPDGVLRAKFEVCSDATGTITTITGIKSSDPKKVHDADYAAHIKTTAKTTWKLAPLAYKGASAATCFHTDHTYPKEATLDEMMKRVATGNRIIPWDAETKAAYPEQTWGAALNPKVCIDGVGNVTSAILSPGLQQRYPSWWKTIETEIKTWTFTPFVVGKDAWPMCGLVRVEAAPPKR
jgi:hypothetical protein